MTAAAFPGDGELVGAILSDKYRLVRFIGAGGMGVVYEAVPVAGGPSVAIKMLRAEYLDDIDVLTRFADEGHMCQRLRHPNVVQVFEVGHAEDTTPYLVMELLQGIPLASYTNNGGRVPLLQAATVMQGILQGLGMAHAQGIVHRDLKPENVVLARDASGKFTPKILDFGIAKVMEQAGGMGQRTRTGVLLGTPAYMSPEQIKSAKDCDARSDLWSAGVMFYEMLTGRSAFPAPTAYARLGAVLNTVPPPVESIDPQLQRIAGFVARAMDKDRNQRFQSAHEMGRALAQAMGDEAGGRDDALSRLPEMPMMASVAHPNLPHHGFGLVGVHGQAHGHGERTVADRFTPPSGRVSVGPSGTLASGASPRVTEPPPEARVEVALPARVPGKTLPSTDDAPLTGPRPSAGVPAWAVALVAAACLAVGLFVGFLLHR
ncbi:MAG: serine/threonine protein kinase [Myxococcales bacterium]|nr:serine/threonine protein kinase [Myxococcales bacterium]MBL0195021.1 serine/threonine protein kinase [Myxococcales bacterium]HQY61760.1 serine/threonine-protein kinase [Polyangiaceae bacterium]